MTPTILVSDHGDLMAAARANYPELTDFTQGHSHVLARNDKSEWVEISHDMLRMHIARASAASPAA